MIEERPELGRLRFAARDQIDIAAAARAAGDGHRAAEDLPAHRVQREGGLREAERAARMREGRQLRQEHDLVIGELVLAGDLGRREIGKRQLELQAQPALAARAHRLREAPGARA